MCKAELLGSALVSAQLSSLSVAVHLLCIDTCLHLHWVSLQSVYVSHLLLSLHDAVKQ